MSKIEFIGARVDKNVINMIEDTAKEDSIDKTKALMKLVILGRRQYLLEKYLQLYRNGICSLDKAAEKIGINVAEMMQEAAKLGIYSTETIDEYKRGLEILEKL